MNPTSLPPFQNDLFHTTFEGFAKAVFRKLPLDGDLRYVFVPEALVVRERGGGSDIAVQVVQEIQGDEGDVRAVSRIWRILHEGVFTFIHYIC